MNDIFVFSGTTEGRELSEFLSDNCIKHTVFVATEYGRTVMKESSFADIREGRLTESEMLKLFKKEKPGRVYDATHPYAVEVSENIRKALYEAGCAEALCRIKRSIGHEACGQTDDRVITVYSVTEAVEYLKKTDGNILLTTGVKTLPMFAAKDSLRNRLTVRILPSKESLENALDAGLLPKNIIAMEGPFTQAVNEALIDQYHIDILVTKNSGARGGFAEKAEASAKCGITMLVIENPEKENGVSLEEVKRQLTAEYSAKIKETPEKQYLTAIGIGMGDDRSLTLEAYRRIEKAELLIGAERMLRTGRKINDHALTECLYEKNQVIEAVRKHGLKNNVFLLSGDTGFYSGASALEAVCEGEGLNIELEILPGISSISYLCAMLKIPYSGAELLSAHGRDVDISQQLKNKEDFFAITSGREDFNRIANCAVSSGLKCSLVMGFNLGMTDQEVWKKPIERFVPADRDGLYVIGVLFDR